jgi:hypothetical protein
MRSLIIYGFLFFVGITIASFQLPDSIAKTVKSPMVLAKIEEDINAYYKERMVICKLNILQEAEAYVDSIIVNKIDLNIIRGMSFPSRPQKPSFPNQIILNDTTVIQPLLKGKSAEVPAKPVKDTTLRSSTTPSKTRKTTSPIW